MTANTEKFFLVIVTVNQKSLSSDLNWFNMKTFRIINLFIFPLTFLANFSNKKDSYLKRTFVK